MPGNIYKNVDIDVIEGYSFVFIEGLHNRYELESFDFGQANINFYDGGKNYYIYSNTFGQFPILHYKKYKATGLLITDHKHIICALKKRKKWKIYDETKESLIKTNSSDEDIKKEIINKELIVTVVLYKYVG